MIEVTVKNMEGVTFYSKVRVLEPDFYRNGVGVHRVSRDTDKELIFALRALGLRKVDYDASYHEDLYVAFPISYLRYKVVEAVFKVYWHVIRWLYDNMRFFKQIPREERFSWRYFTPYCWYRRIRK